LSSSQGFWLWFWLAHKKLQVLNKTNCLAGIDAKNGRIKEDSTFWDRAWKHHHQFRAQHNQAKLILSMDKDHHTFSVLLLRIADLCIFMQRLQIWCIKAMLITNKGIKCSVTKRCFARL
jgi:hypothetical protein